MNSQWPVRVTDRHWSFLLRCSRSSECSRGQGPEQWLWSFQSELGCLRVAAMSPANISREETREVNDQIGRALVGRALGIKVWVEILDPGVRHVRYHMASHKSLLLGAQFAHVFLTQARGRLGRPEVC